MSVKGNGRHGSNPKPVAQSNTASENPVMHATYNPNDAYSKAYDHYAEAHALRNAYDFFFNKNNSIYTEISQ